MRASSPSYSLRSLDAAGSVDSIFTSVLDLNPRGSPSLAKQVDFQLAALMAARRLSHCPPHDPTYRSGSSLSHDILQEPGLIERF